ncbi:zinc finger protein 483-like protein, partial [Leptotrombidium deliense]
MPLQFVKSNKGANQLQLDGYIYTRDKSYNGKTLWKCIEFHNFKCKGRVHTSNDEIVKTI